MHRPLFHVVSGSAGAPERGLTGLDASDRSPKPHSTASDPPHDLFQGVLKTTGYTSGIRRNSRASATSASDEVWHEEMRLLSDSLPSFSRSSRTIGIIPVKRRSDERRTPELELQKWRREGSGVMAREQCGTRGVGIALISARATCSSYISDIVLRY